MVNVCDFCEQVCIKSVFRNSGALSFQVDIFVGVLCLDICILLGCFYFCVHRVFCGHSLNFHAFPCCTLTWAHSEISCTF